MNVLRSLLFYIVMFIVTIILGLVALAICTLTGNKDRAHLVARLWGNVCLWTAGVKVKVNGLENLDSGRPCIYTANHQSLFDIFVALGKLPVQFRWLAKEELFSLFVMGPAMKAIGYIPIDRTDRRKAFASINLAAERVRNGTSIFIFPEGTRSSDGVLKDFKKGGFILAIKSQQPMVPISISGTHKVLAKKGGWIIHPGTIQMTIGTPIPTAGRTVKDRDTLIAAVKEGIRLHLTAEEAGGRKSATN